MYKSKTILLFFCALFMNSSVAEVVNKIDSPDGLYYVNPKGVNKISVVGEKDNDGDYKIQIYNEVSIYSAIQSGELTIRGWWYPALQQFNFQNYEKVIGVSRCNKWGERKWSFKYIQEKVNVLGRDISVYKQIYDYGKNNKPSGSCVGVRIDTNTCERHRCNSWEDPKPNGYIVKSKQDAHDLFYLIKE